MAVRAGPGIDSLAPLWIRGSWSLQGRIAPTHHFGSDRDILGQPPDIGEQPAHLVAVGGQGLAVHGPQEAAVDAVLHGPHAPGPGQVGGEGGPEAHHGRGVGRLPGVQVAAAAAEGISRIRRRVLGGVREDLLAQADRLADGPLGDGRLLGCLQGHLDGLGRLGGHHAQAENHEAHP